MIRKLFLKWQAYKDKLFLERLNRVLADNILESDVITLRDILEPLNNPRYPGAFYTSKDYKKTRYIPIIKKSDGYYYIDFK